MQALEQNLAPVLKQFASATNYRSLDQRSLLEHSSSLPLLAEGGGGRPTREEMLMQLEAAEMQLNSITAKSGSSRAGRPTGSMSKSTGPGTKRM